MSEQAKESLTAIGRALDSLSAEDRKYLLGFAAGMEAAAIGKKSEEAEKEGGS